MTVPHKPCPWCGTVKCLEPSGMRIVCDECGCQGPDVHCISYEPRAATEARAWKVWDDLRTTEWQDYEVVE